LLISYLFVLFIRV